MRMCIGCREMKPKKDLVRIVTPKEGETHVDLSGKANGRGAYVCKNEACLGAAAKMKAIRLSDEIFNTLREQIANTE